MAGDCSGKSTHSRGKSVSSDAKAAGNLQIPGCEPTLGAFLGAGLDLETQAWPRKTDEVFFYLRPSASSISIDNNILLNNIKIRWLGAVPIIGIVEFSHITFQNF